MICKYCGIDQPDSHFQSAGIIKGKRYFRKKCTKCKTADQDKRKDSIIDWFNEYRSTLCCAHCGNTDTRVFDFHHLDPSEKEHSIADMRRNGFSKLNIIKEVNKCICLCANCHRILHFEETNGV